MDYRQLAGKTALSGLVLILISNGILGQSAKVPQTGRDLSEMTLDEVAESARNIVAAKVPEHLTDQLIFMAMNRSDVVVPELLGGIKAVLAEDQPNEQLAHKMADIIAYAGDERSVDSVSELCNLDAARFCYFVKRALTYASGRRNSFSLAYRALEKLDPKSHQLVAGWVHESLAYGRFVDQWAEALLDRYHGAPTENDLATDPIAGLGGGVPMAVRVHIQALVVRPSASPFPKQP